MVLIPETGRDTGKIKWKFAKQMRSNGGDGGGGSGGVDADSDAVYSLAPLVCAYLHTSRIGESELLIYITRLRAEQWYRASHQCRSFSSGEHYCAQCRCHCCWWWWWCVRLNWLNSSVFLQSLRLVSGLVRAASSNTTVAFFGQFFLLKCNSSPFESLPPLICSSSLVATGWFFASNFLVCLFCFLLILIHLHCRLSFLFLSLIICGFSAAIVEVFFGCSATPAFCFLCAKSTL